MTRRADPKRKARPYHGFPWPRPAVDEAVRMATEHERDSRAKRATYRQIADYLWAYNLVPHRPDPATVRRMLRAELRGGAA